MPVEATTAAACHRKTSERQVAQLHTKTMGTNGLRKRELTFSIGPGRWPNWAIRRRQTPKGGWRQVRDDSQGLPDHLRDMRKPQRSAEHEDGKPVPECRRCVEESRAEERAESVARVQLLRSGHLHPYPLPAATRAQHARIRSLPGWSQQHSMQGRKSKGDTRHCARNETSTGPLAPGIPRPVRGRI